ncbi:MAG: UDP-N-acetylmuramoyl-tripeptide--D-alanyl-D-alanine ligase, partial [Methylobacterium sp.]|nr:UDP-N-acetylmuramoyl-tripeptide--D-alanyl-D-alanine ligase [Methylobacterium sp.]
MVKGSNSIRMGRIVEALKARYAKAQAEPPHAAAR